MATLWQKKDNNTLYEVRSAGSTRRLYTNNVFHSQYNPNKILQGGIWDLLYLPAFCFSPDTLQRVLVLGVGGGTVLQQLCRYMEPTKIIGIELNRTHLYIAKKYFSVSHASIELIEANAVDWLEKYKGDKFDLIIDDLFGHQDGDAERAIKLNKQWSACLLNQLQPGGMLVVNFGSNKEFRNSALIAYKKLASTFKSIVRLSLSSYENAIGVFANKNISPKAMRSNFYLLAGLNTRIQKQQLKYNVKIFK